MRGASGQRVLASDRSILYIVSRFPRISETFIVHEWWSLAEHFRLGIVTLMKGDRMVAHPEAERLRPHIRYLPLLGARTVAANLYYIVRRPRLYAGTLLTVLRGSYRQAGGGAAKGVVVFLKSNRIARIVEREGYDHVHAHFIHHPATAAFAIHRLTGVPFSLTAHGSDLFVDPALLPEKIREAALTISVSEYNRSYIRQRLPRGGRIEIVHCGVDLGNFTFKPRTHIRRVISVARLVPLKGHSTLIRAFAAVLEHDPGLMLEIVGEGPEAKSLLDLCRDLGVDSQVQFHGALTAPSVRAALDAADLFVLATCERPDGSIFEGRMDGIPVSLIEAMASGLPVISTRVSGIPELVVDEGTGLLVPPDDPKQLGDAMIRLIEDPAFAARLARQAREHVEESFALARQSSVLVKLFADLMAPTPGEGCPPTDPEATPTLPASNPKQPAAR